MPLYEYECDACGERFEVIQKFSDPAPDACTKCGKGPVRRLMSSPAIQFKGSGFYITDYAQKGKGGRGNREGGSKGKSDAGKSDSATESKSDGERQESAGKESAAKEGSAKSDAPASSSSSTDHVEHQERLASDADLQIERFQIAAKRVGQVWTLQREIHHRLQEAQLVAGVVAHAIDLVGVDRAIVQESPQAVGQLDFAGAIADRRLERAERYRASGCSGR